MASDEKILQFKDLKTYNNRVKQFVEENAGGSGGSTTLADLGITVTATQINEIPSIKSTATSAGNKAATASTNEENYRIRYYYNCVTIPSGNTYYSTTINTGLSSTNYRVVGGYVSTGGSVAYYSSGGYWYAILSFQNKTSSAFDQSVDISTFYHNN